MPKGIMIVESGPVDPAQDAEFNEWYDNTHLPEVRAVPGFVSGQRYRAHTPDGAPAPGHPYLAIYEIEADDFGDALAALRARRSPSDLVGMNPPPVVRLYELIDAPPR